MVDGELTMANHISHLTRTCFYHLRQLRVVRRSLTTDTAHALIRALVHSRLDYCNGTLAGLPQYQLNKLQSISGVAMIFGPPPQTTCLGSWPRVYGDYFFLAGPWRAPSTPRAPPRSRGPAGPSLRHCNPSSVPQPDLFCYYLDEPASPVWCVFGSTGFLSHKESNLNWAVLFTNVSMMLHQHTCPNAVSRFPLKRAILSYVLQLPEIFSFHLPELLQSEAGVFP